MNTLFTWGWIVISPQQVPARHYFLESLQNPVVLGTIRILGIGAAIGALAVYKKMKGKNE